jgi:hypothetical protein
MVAVLDDLSRATRRPAIPTLRRPSRHYQRRRRFYRVCGRKGEVARPVLAIRADARHRASVRGDCARWVALLCAEPRARHDSRSGCTASQIQTGAFSAKSKPALTAGPTKTRRATASTSTKWRSVRVGRSARTRAATNRIQPQRGVAHATDDVMSDHAGRRSSVGGIRCGAQAA